MNNDGSLQIWFAVVLVILVTCSAYLAAATLQEREAQIERRAIYEEYIEQAQALLDQQQWIATGATDSYRADAYDLSVDRIAEQQLIAAEYQLLLLQTIAQQNAMIIELMMVRP